jgi:hypothetical protein
VGGERVRRGQCGWGEGSVGGERAVWVGREESLTSGVVGRSMTTG